MTEQQEKAQLRLTAITRYDDVETGRLELSLGEKKKTWNAVWMTDLRLTQNREHGLPRGELDLNLDKARGLWVFCPKIKLTRRTAMWIVPLQAYRWTDFGVDLYMCDRLSYRLPMSREEYTEMVEALRHYKIKTLTVEEPVRRVEGNKLEHSFENIFWRETQEE